METTFISFALGFALGAIFAETYIHYKVVKACKDDLERRKKAEAFYKSLNIKV